jgi:hypothetical protein
LKPERQNGDALHEAVRLQKCDAVFGACRSVKELGILSSSQPSLVMDLPLSQKIKRTTFASIRVTDLGN